MTKRRTSWKHGIQRNKRHTDPNHRGLGDIDRRGFLRNMMVLGGGLTSFAGVGPFKHLGYADALPSGEPRFYVFAYFGGGWDVLLGLDPRDPRRFNQDNVATTRIMPGYDLLGASGLDLITTDSGIELGPYIGELADQIDKLCIVRGMSMETLTHAVGRRRFLTGKAPAGLAARGSSAATWLASQLGVTEPIANLAVNVESYNRDQPTYASALSVDSVPDLIEVLRSANPQLAQYEAAALNDLLSGAADCDQALGSSMWQAAEEARQRADFTVASGFSDLFEFGAGTEEMEGIRDHYGIGTDMRSPEAQAAMAGQSLMAGITRVVSFQAASGLDTHFDNWIDEQGPRQQRGFNAVARLAADLEAHEYLDTGKSWLDHTTIVGFSEFSRTPMLNSSDGRDHALMNSCFLMGGNVRGGQVIGESTNIGMGPTAVHLPTGAVSVGGDVIRPEHIIQSLFADAGMTGDPADLRVDPLGGIFF
ncbi:MAG: hypothetical protein ACJAYU_003216 [Bradymonadia bacterium]|jgi:hypothetical protein